MNQNLIDYVTIKVQHIITIILHILSTLQLQPYLLTMASKQSPSISTYIVKGQDPMPQQPNTAHGNSDVSTTSAPNPALSHAVHKIVTDVAEVDISFSRIQKDVSDRSNKNLS